MKTVKKRKIKIKKKNFVIFILIIIGISTLITTTTNKLIKLLTSDSKETVKQEKRKDPHLKFKKFSYFNKNYLNRYLKYEKNNPNLTPKQVVKNVNMNLDKIKYEDINKTKYLNDPKILVNKYNYLESTYTPENLEIINNNYALNNMKLVNYAKDAFEAMAKKAKQENLNIIAMSTYRSYDYQIELYNRYVKSDGKEKADTYSGRPGFSEHQTGLAVDVYNKEKPYTSFEETKEFTWMQEHAHEFGFILRFPKEKEAETGYQYESWHYRYVGTEIAKYIKEHNISYEEYYATKIKDW